MRPVSWIEEAAALVSSVWIEEAAPSVCGWRESGCGIEIGAWLEIAQTLSWLVVARDAHTLS